MNKIKIGARGSLLSKAYVKKVKSLFLKIAMFFEKDIFLKEIKTSGDIFKEKNYQKLVEKNYFAKRLRKNY